VVYPARAYTGLYGRVYAVSEDVSVERLSVAEAAEALGVTRDAIHKRITRGTIEHEKGEDGRFYVYVDTSTRGLDSSMDTSKDDSKVETLERLLEHQQDRIAFLERVLEEEREARTEERRRHDTLMAQLMQRIPELEPPAPPESPEPREPGPHRVRPERAGPVEPVDPRRGDPERVVPERVEPERVHPRESPMVAADEQQGRGPVPDAGAPQEAAQPQSREPWWRRMFGG
jgi:predicted DNA-binding protein YlxM (UPF0122 family)